MEHAVIFTTRTISFGDMALVLVDVQVTKNETHLANDTMDTIDTHTHLHTHTRTHTHNLSPFHHPYTAMRFTESS